MDMKKLARASATTSEHLAENFGIPSSWRLAICRLSGDGDDVDSKRRPRSSRPYKSRMRVTSKVFVNEKSQASTQMHHGWGAARFTRYAVDKACLRSCVHNSCGHKRQMDIWKQPLTTSAEVPP